MKSYFTILKNNNLTFKNIKLSYITVFCLIENDKYVYYHKSDYKNKYRKYYDILLKNSDCVKLINFWYAGCTTLILKNKKLHCLDNPAYINNINTQYYIDGVYYDFENWNKHSLVIARKRLLKLNNILDK